MVLSWLARRRLKVARFTVRDPLHANIGGNHWGHGGPTRFDSCTSLLLVDWKQAIPHFVTPTGSILWTVNQHWVATDPRRGSAPQWANASFRAADAASPENVSVRTFRRRLAMQGSSFRGLRSQAIVRDAVQRLRATDAKIDEIAERMGYADARSFRRLLKNVTGMSPSEIRTHGFSGLAGAESTLLQHIEILSRHVAT